MSSLDSPPGSKLAAPRAREHRRPILLAALAGLVVDIGATFISGSIAAVMLALSVGATDGSSSALQELLGSSGWLFFNLVLGTACTVLGGYVAARIANQRELLCGLALGALNLVASEAMLGLSDLTESYPIGLRIASIIVVMPAGIVGGWLRKRQALRRST